MGQVGAEVGSKVASHFGASSVEVPRMVEGGEGRGPKMLTPRICSCTGELWLPQLGPL